MKIIKPLTITHTNIEYVDHRGIPVNVPGKISFSEIVIRAPYISEEELHWEILKSMPGINLVIGKKIPELKLEEKVYYGVLPLSRVGGDFTCVVDSVDPI